jgi:DNA-binding XRE family transcriptional regulator
MAGALIILEEVDIADLPPLAQELVRLIGFSATMRLVDMRPGLPTYIPKEASDHHVLSVIGMGAFKKLVEEFGGESVTIPNCKLALTKLRHRNARKLRAQGYSQTEVAHLTGITPRQVRNIESAEPKEENNLSLF